MNLVLPPEIQKLIDERIESGRYESVAEVIAAAISSLDQQERVTNPGDPSFDGRRSEIHAMIAEGFAEAEAGRLSDGEAFFSELEAEEAECDHPATGG